MCSTFYRERLGALLGWYSEWTSCEQVITLCYLLSHISSIQAKFLSLFLASHPATADSRDVEILEQEANSPNFLSGLHREPDEVVLSHLLSHLPLLKVDSHLARREYLNLLPKVLLGSCEHAHYLDQCWQLLCLSVLHPAFPPDDKNSLNYWLLRLREKSRAVEHKQQMLVMGGPVPPHMPLHGGYFPQIQPSLPSPGPPQHSSGPVTGTGNFFPLLSSAPMSHAPMSPPAPDPAPPPHLPLQQSDSGIVLTDPGASRAADFSAPLRPSQMLWSPNKQPEGDCQPNAFRMPNGIIPHFNGLPQRTRDTDNKGDPVIRSLSYPLSKKVGNGSHSPPQQSTEFGLHFDSCNSNTNSSSSGEYEFSAKQDVFVNGPGMQEVPNWLKALRLHKYQDIFSHLTYKEMLSLDESKLECENVTTGARHKIMQCIQKLTARSHLLSKLDQDLNYMPSVSPDSQELIAVISELRSVVISPMPAYGPTADLSPSVVPPQAAHDEIAILEGSRNADGSREDPFSPSREFASTPPIETLSPASQLSLAAPPPMGEEVLVAETRQLVEANITDVHCEDMPSIITIIISKVYIKLVGLVDFEEDSMVLFIQTLEKAISHEAFVMSHKKLFIEWKSQLERASIRHHALRMTKANLKKSDSRMLRTRNSWSAGSQPVAQITPLNRGVKQWRAPNKLAVPHVPIHNAYIPPPPMPSGVQLPLTSVRSFPSGKYTNYIPMKTNINKAKSFPTHYPNNGMECFTEQLSPNEENGMMLADRIKCGLSNNINPDFNHVQTNDVYIESLCRSMTDHALDDSSPEVANSYLARNTDASSSYL